MSEYEQLVVGAEFVISGARWVVVEVNGDRLVVHSAGDPHNLVDTTTEHVARALRVAH